MSCTFKVDIENLLPNSSLFTHPARIPQSNIVTHLELCLGPPDEWLALLLALILVFWEISVSSAVKYIHFVHHVVASCGNVFHVNVDHISPVGEKGEGQMRLPPNPPSVITTFLSCHSLLSVWPRFVLVFGFFPLILPCRYLGVGLKSNCSGCASDTPTASMRQSSMLNRVLLTEASKGRIVWSHWSGHSNSHHPLYCAE